ncbi:MAG: hypothetical protein WBA12_02200, partial [Catalinimonas sp.]
MKKFLLLVALSLSVVPAWAQDDDDYEYKEEIGYGLTTNTNSSLVGGIMFKYAKARTPRQYVRYGIEIVNIKHPKERRNQQGFQGSYIEAKANYLFALRPHYGREFVLFRKAPEDGVQLNFYAAAGPSIGLVKPYYVRYTLQGGNNEIYSDPY